ncbi:MAG: methylated-DNA--[protein]-cysteine S-methyltransferase [Bacillota bacterium]|jgi:methylated-DNA-[protein]-cysteine S-methyltransferase
MAIYIYTSPIGEIGIGANDEEITHLYLKNDIHSLNYRVCNSEVCITPIIKEAKVQLDAYFAGKLREFDLPLAPSGTEFRKKIWELLLKIPYGETRTYGQIAAEAGNPKASRAVGQANHNNPISIIIPCHRVIGANGKLVGYGGGLDIKRKLLMLEKENLTNFI